MTSSSLPNELSAIAPRLARARDQHEAHVNRGIHRCSCGYGWRVDGHEYDTNGCIDRIEWARQARDRFEKHDAELAAMSPSERRLEEIMDRMRRGTW